MSITKEQYFYFSDGSSTKSIEELKEKIESLSYEEFYNHVNEEKNDFANWIEGVFHENTLAQKLRKVNSIVETVELLNEFINPKKTKQYEETLGDEDFQKLIEDALFGDLDEPEEVKEELPEEAKKDLDEVKKSDEKEKEKEKFEDNKSELVTKEDLEEMTNKAKQKKDIKLRELVLKKDGEKHISITETKEGKESEKMKEIKKHYNSFLVKETLWGFLLGLIVGFILGRIISFFI